MRLTLPFCIINSVSISRRLIGLTLLPLIAGGQGRQGMHPPQALNPGTSVRRPPGQPACCLGQNFAEHHNQTGALWHDAPRTIPYIVPYPVYVDSRGYLDPSQTEAPLPTDSAVPQSSETPGLEYPSVLEASPPASPAPDDPPTQLVAPQTSCAVSVPLQNSVEPVEAFIALKDHRIHTAVAYWILGDTLHYITPLGIHNQVSLRLVNRSLTARLNSDRLLQLVLPPE